MRNRATTPLSKAKIRQSWSKYNLFNLNRFRAPPTVNRTFFQQKWTAKSVARAYHGEQVRESQWSRMFTRRIRSVVPMSPEKLASDDGSAMSAGRGAGLESEADCDGAAGAKDQTSLTPFTQMTFAPLERRLDVAIFRAMFASSTRQARQFVVHGAVTVNGKKMRYPGYLLNPGDLFQVEPERVMYATGAPKDKFERRESRVARRKAAESNEGETEAEGAAAETEGKQDESEIAEAQDQQKDDPKGTLKTLLTQAKTIMSNSKDVLPAKRKQELRGFQKAVRRVLSRSESSTVLTDNLESQFSELITLLKAKKAEKKGGKESEETSSTHAKQTSKTASESTDTTTTTATSAAENKPSDKLSEAFQKAAQNPDEEVDTSELTEEEFEVLRRALIQMRDNPIDHSKPYATPWRPRDYMSAFAFIPRYLEVNHNICAAVYLRHPVARPGRTEVPTPFNENISTAAFSCVCSKRRPQEEFITQITAPLLSWVPWPTGHHHVNVSLAWDHRHQHSRSPSTSTSPQHRERSGRASNRPYAYGAVVVALVVPDASAPMAAVHDVAVPAEREHPADHLVESADGGPELAPPARIRGC
ncbi:hypothetical protein CNMCM6106_007347 [Aspergillus hiratsukae]|uniref:Small ribosomal subunit protein uS4m n=1 Tax=Aspergillus hiratsukae TaxID=1194566 RepID=A0A8H6QHT0_9EURO|nr:hypothetical protein CNMCM6106_007347 [Aspergillus hiratsukae]